MLFRSIPDRFFWALPPGEEGAPGEGDLGVAPGDEADAAGGSLAGPRRVH